MPFTITTLTPSDWQLFKQIRLDALRIAPESYGTNVDDYIGRPDSYWQNYLENPANRILLAFTDNKPAGFVRLNLADDEIPEEYAYLGSLFVYPEYRGKGIAKLLIQSAENYVLENSNKSGIHLEVYEFLTNAVRLYENLGYKTIEKRIEEGQHDLVMIKELR